MHGYSKRGEGLSHFYAWHKGLRDSNVINFSLPTLAQQTQHVYWHPVDNYGVLDLLNNNLWCLKTNAKKYYYYYFDLSFIYTYIYICIYIYIYVYIQFNSVLFV